MNRIEKLLHGLRRDGRGLEIGPSHNPVAPKRGGFRVETVDHLDRDGLIAKYRGHGVDLDRIEPVDHVWQGQALTDIIRDHGQYDWIIASHVIEHVPDLVGFVNQCATLLAPEGVLSLAVPDLRNSFDCMRWPTTTGELLQAHVDRRKTHGPGKVFDYFTTVVSRDGAIVWGKPGPGRYALVHSFEQAEQFMREAIETGAYRDLHTWVFTPTSFRLAIADLRRLGMLAMGETRFFDSVDGEFHVSLGKQAPLPEIDRIQWMQRIRSELPELLG
ncbi:MAG: methyltransferase domain-containing protein [Lysobacterales bacterium]